MKVSTKNISPSINFNQVVELEKQLPYEEKVKLWEVIRKETETNIEDDKVFTHLASERSLAKTGSHLLKMKQGKICKR